MSDGLNGNGGVPQVPVTTDAPMPLAGVVGTDFVAFAVGAGANVASQASYLSDPQTGTGNLPGVARSNFVNKTLRQGAFGTAGVSTFITEQIQQYVSDDGDIPKWVNQFRDALRALFLGLIPPGPDLSLYLPIAGGTMQGNIYYAGSATSVLNNGVYLRGRDTGGVDHGIIRVDPSNNVHINDGFATYIVMNGYPLTNNNVGYACRDTGGGAHSIIRVGGDNHVYVGGYNALFLQTTGGYSIYFNSHLIMLNSTWLHWNLNNGVPYNVAVLDGNNNFTIQSPGDFWINTPGGRQIVLNAQVSVNGEIYCNNVMHFHNNAYLTGFLWINSTLQVNGGSNFYGHLNVNNGVGASISGNLDCNYIHAWGSSAVIDGNLAIGGQFNSNTVYSNYIYSYGNAHTSGEHDAYSFYAADHFYTNGWYYGGYMRLDAWYGTSMNNTPYCANGLSIYPAAGQYDACHVYGGLWSSGDAWFAGGRTSIGSGANDWYNPYASHWGECRVGYTVYLYHGVHWGDWPDCYIQAMSGLGFPQIGVPVQLPSLEVRRGGWAAKPGGGMWYDNCDARVKKWSEPFTRGLAEIMHVNPINYQYNGRGGTNECGRTYQGVIAQEVEDFIPEMVHRNMRVRQGPDDYLEYLEDQRMVDYTPLVFALVNAVKELSTRVAQLEGN